MLRFVRVIKNTCVFSLHIPEKLAVKDLAFSSHFFHSSQTKHVPTWLHPRHLCNVRLEGWAGPKVEALDVIRRYLAF